MLAVVIGIKGRLHSHFCVRCPVRDGAAAQPFPLLFSRDHVRDRAKEAVGQWRHRGRRNRRKKRECRRPFKRIIKTLKPLYVKRAWNRWANRQSETRIRHVYPVHEIKNLT
jgi:hypothetical protein